MRAKRSSLLILAASLICAAFSAAGQTPRPNFNRAQTFDVQHYVIRVSFDRAKKKVFGDTTVTFKPLKSGFQTLDLDAVWMTFESVTLDSAGTKLAYKTAPGKVSITLDKPYGPEDTISVRLKYSTVPTKGVYFVAAEQGHSAQIWSQGEADENRHWFPSFDFPSDKATSEEYITAQANETVVGNGELLGKQTNSDGTVTWHYKMPVPHSSYLTSFAIGEYVRVDDRYGDIPLGYFIYPGREQTARNAYGKTPDMIKTYEELTGIKFPYNKYDQTVVAHFQFGGMENITATTMADIEIFFADSDFGKETTIDLVSHELAHSWFGDMLTCKNWAELWLNEGFATYMEAAYRERAFGREDYIRKVNSDAAQFMISDGFSRKRIGLFNRNAANVESLFDGASAPVTYNKGGAVLHTLREQVGTENFWKALNTYLNRFRFSNVETTDLQKVMEETSGQDLKWFFDQWVYGTSFPHVSVAQTYSTRTKTLKVTLTQTQRAEPLTPSVFRLPLDIKITASKGSSDQKIEMNKRVQVFTFKVDTKPAAVVIDPNDRVPLKSLKQGPIVAIR